MLPMELISYEELMADHRLNPDHATQVKLRAGINEYAMVVIDEAHNLRNPATQRAEALRRLLADSPPKQLVLLTATPVKTACGTCTTSSATSCATTPPSPTSASPRCGTTSPEPCPSIPTT